MATLTQTLMQYRIITVFRVRPHDSYRGTAKQHRCQYRPSGDHSAKPLHPALHLSCLRSKILDELLTEATVFARRRYEDFVLSRKTRKGLRLHSFCFLHSSLGPTAQDRCFKATARFDIHATKARHVKTVIPCQEHTMSTLC